MTTTQFSSEARSQYNAKYKIKCAIGARLSSFKISLYQEIEG